MTWKHRRGGNWSTPTPKVRKDGQWVSLGSGGGGGSGGTVDTSAYYTDGPPTRSGTTHTYDSTNYSSLQSMLTSGNVTAGDSVYIDPVNSPYVENTDLTHNTNHPDHITIYSDWDISFNTNGTATINQEGATLKRPSGKSYALDLNRIYAHPENFGTTSLDGPHWGIHQGANTTEINVIDSSGISAGDQIVIHEDSRAYGLKPSGGASGAGDTMEFARVVSVSGNTITIDQPLAMDYPNNSTTDVGPVDWTIEDLHLHGLKFDAAGGTSCAMFGSTYNSWFNDIIGRGANDRKPTFYNQASFFNRFHNLYMYDGNDYGLNSQDGTTRTMVTNVMSHDHSRYTVRFGPRGHATPRGYVNNIAGKRLSRTVGGVHQGGHHINYENLTATDTRAIVTRSWYIDLDGFEVNGGNTQGPVLVCAQQPGYVNVRNGTISGMEGLDQGIWQFRLRGSSAPYGPERLEHVTYENIHIEPFSDRSLTSLGHFETESDSPTSGPLTFRNITFGNQKLTKSDVTSWNGYDSSVLPDLTVE